MFKRSQSTLFVSVGDQRESALCMIAYHLPTASSFGGSSLESLHELRSQRPTPLRAIRFTSLVVASRQSNDEVFAQGI